MKMNKKAIVSLLTLVTIAAVMLAGCGGGTKTDYSALQGDVVKGSSVYVDDGDVVFFGYDNLLCSALFQEGAVDDFVVEAGFTGEVYALAIYDGFIYISASDGFFAYDLDMFTGKADAAPVVLWEKNLSRFNSFQIYDGKIFFLYGVDLCWIPLEGGEETKVATEVGDFEVTSDGIFYSKKDGSLHQLSTDLKEDKEVGTVASAVPISLGRDGVYFKQKGVLKCCSPDSGETVDVETTAALGEYTYPWVNGGTIMYSDDDNNYYLITDKGEEMVGNMFEFPQKYNGFKYKDWVVSQTTYYRQLDVIDFRDGTHNSYDLEAELADDISKASGNSGKSGDSPGTVSSSGDYDIMDGFMKNASADGSAAYMYFNDFLLIMPNNDKYTMIDNKDEVSFYLYSAQQDGYDGKLVTIKAYDLDDDSYEQLPSYSVGGVGKNVGKRFVAIFPTDAPWNTNDAQQTADYKELSDYLHKIGEGAVNSPLQTADSD